MKSINEAICSTIIPLAATTETIKSKLLAGHEL